MTSIVGTGSSATETVGGEDRSNRVSLWKIRTIFQKFCNTDGFLGYEDFKKLDNETEEEGAYSFLLQNGKGTPLSSKTKTTVNETPAT